MFNLNKELSKVSIKNPLSPGFWLEWRDDFHLVMIAALISIVLLLVLQLIITIPTELQRATIFSNMLLISIVVMGIDMIGDVLMHKKLNTIVQWVGFGPSWIQALVALIVGAVFGMAAFPVIGAVSTPMAVIEVVNPVWVFIYVVLLAPFVEEKFFRGFVLPTLSNVFVQFRFFDAWNAGVLACGIQTIAFGYMHWVAYGASSEGIVSAMMMGLICGVGNYIFNSTLFGISLHVVNNYVVAFLRPV